MKGKLHIEIKYKCKNKSCYQWKILCFGKNQDEKYIKKTAIDLVNGVDDKFNLCEPCYLKNYKLSEKEKTSLQMSKHEGDAKYVAKLITGKEPKTIDELWKEDCPRGNTWAPKKKN